MQKKAQPQGAALKFHQRRRILEECAYTLREHRHEPIMHNAKGQINYFMLLCSRDFLTILLNISKPNRPVGRRKRYRIIRTGTFA